uniref:sensor histidine kinase n=1 Tax=Roseicitreum antarcticum TaxID=564137 RepID=UPI001CC21B1F|nr:sensor histidine kinase [Roseicitreum antarcticum]
MSTDFSSPRADVVLGDDWVRPNSSVETEVRIRRERRGIFSIYSSPLARKIVLFNMLALVLLIAGVLFTNPFRDSLVRQQQLTLITQAELIADMLGSARGPDGTGVGVPDGAGAGTPDGAGAGTPPGQASLAERAGFIDNLTLTPRTEVLLLDGSGGVLLRKLGVAARSSAPTDAGTSESSTTVISDFLEAVWSGLSYITGARLINRGDTSFDTLIPTLHARAMAGYSDSRVVRMPDSGMWFAVAAPVFDAAPPGEGPVAGVVALLVEARDIDQMLRNEREQVLQMFLIALIVSVGLSFVLASTIANPLADLATAAELGRDKDARKVNPGRVRIPDLTGRPDEIGRLSMAMRGMVSALYDRIDANEQFAADVSHEIKNPLASLRSAVGTLRMAKKPEQINRLLDVIEHDVRRLDRLVSDTSNASRLDSELVKEDEETFDLLKTLDNLSEHLSQEAAARGVDFIKALPAEPILISGLEARLAQVFVNLITNAISFCEDGDAVRIWARKNDNRVLIVVEDTGPGIPDQALTKVFKRFYSERPEAQFGNHSGLGLAISKQIVEAHNGVIWAENIRPLDAAEDSPPLGSRFVVGLPI